MAVTPIELARRQHGVVSLAQLNRLGVTESARRHMLASGAWTLVGRRAYVRSGTPANPLQRLLIAVIDVDPVGAVSHDSAAWLWGLPGFDGAIAHVMSERSNPTTTIAGVHVRRVRSLPHGWVTRHQGVPVVRPELLALQLFATHQRRAARLTDRLWSDGLLSGSSVAALLSQLGEHGRNGTAGLRGYLNERGPTYIPPATSLEYRLNEILAELDVPVRRQVDLGDVAWSGRVDFLCEARKLVIEAQSERFHAALSDRTADSLRAERLTEAGFTVVEVWDFDVFHRPKIVIEEIRRALALQAHST